MSFQKIVAIIAVVLLIIVLVMFGIAIHNKKEDDQYPPVTAECPDYWDVTKDSDGTTKCVNTKELGSKNCARTMDFTTVNFLGPNGKCAKQKWANSCQVTWDGITNANGLC